MKIFLMIISFLNGGYMLLDGFYVMLTGKYIGPPEPGPWAALFQKFKVDVFKLGPLFIMLGVAWLVFIYGLFTGQAWAFVAGVLTAVLSLWYLPFGTVISVVVLGMLFLGRDKF